jgi:hypothetical protein
MFMGFVSAIILVFKFQVQLVLNPIEIKWYFSPSSGVVKLTPFPNLNHIFFYQRGGACLHARYKSFAIGSDLKIHWTT